jgi:hypothetical protein
LFFAIEALLSSSKLKLVNNFLNFSPDFPQAL